MIRIRHQALCTPEDQHPTLRPMAAARRHPLALFLIVLSVYSLLHLVARLLLSETLSLDEAEQMVMTQAFRFGYGSQPPLYTWLQILVFKAVGVHLFALVLLKTLVLASLYLFCFLGARRMLETPSFALLASWSLLMSPQFLWESQMDLTHSTLATSLSAATVYQTLRLVTEGRSRDYAMLGVLLGLGTLSKYSFLVFAPALLIATSMEREWRTRLLDRRILLTGAVAILILLPHLHWIAGHLDLVISRTLNRMHVQPAGPSFQATVNGLQGLLLASASFTAPFLLVHLLLFPQTFRSQHTPRNDTRRSRRLLERLFLALFSFLVPAVVALGATNIQDRWMQPLLFLVPSYLFLRAEGVPSYSARLKRFAALLIVLSVVAPLLPLGEVWLGPRSAKFSRLQVRFAPLADQIKASGVTPGLIVAAEDWIGGNLRLFFPDARILSLSTPVLRLPAPDRSGTCLMVWDAGLSSDPSSALRQFVSERLGMTATLPPSATHLEPRSWPAGQRAYRFAFATLPGCPAQPG